jgi:hypothetical protein
MMPTLQMRKENQGKWTIRVTWPDGMSEDIPGFPYEQDADDWITNRFPIWLEEQRKARV